MGAEGSTRASVRLMSHRFDIKTIRLPDRWSGLVLTGCPDATSTESSGRNLPTLAQWRPLLSQLVADPASLPGCEVLKFSKNGQVLRAQFVTHDLSLNVICRQARARGLRRRVATLIRGPRERRNFNRALMLLEAGINTALPLAVIQRRVPRREAWLLTEFVENLTDLDQMALQHLPRMEAKRRRKTKDAIVTTLLDLLTRMERRNLSHRDLKASNILLVNWDKGDGPASAWVVDLDGFGHAGSTRPGVQRRPLIRLAASLLGYRSITRSDYARFLRSYLEQRGAPREAWKQHFLELAEQAEDYVVRAERRKTHKLDGYEKVR